MKIFNKIGLLLLTFFIAGSISYVTGFNIWAVFGAMLCFSLIKAIKPIKGVLKSEWTPQIFEEALRYVLKKLPPKIFKGGQDVSSKIKNGVLHIGDIDGEPEVVVNATMPLPEPTEIPVKDNVFIADRLDTKPTFVSGTEYNETEQIMAHVKKHHRAIVLKTMQLGVHNIAKDTEYGEPTIKGCDKFTLKNLYEMLRFASENDFIGKRCVLHPQHLIDLLETEETFLKQYKDSRTGEFFTFMNIEFEEYKDTPIYSASETIKTFNSKIVAEDKISSLFFDPFSSVCGFDKIEAYKNDKKQAVRTKRTEMSANGDVIARLLKSTPMVVLTGQN